MTPLSKFGPGERQVQRAPALLAGRQPLSSRGLCPTMEEEDPFYEDLPTFELVCKVCKGTDFAENDYVKTCIDCGTQVQGHIEEQTEYVEGGNTIKRKPRKRKKKEKVYEPRIETRPSAAVGFEAFQFVLQALLGALVSRCGCDAEVASEVRALWFRVVPLCAEAVAETTHLRRVPTMTTTSKVEVSLGPTLALALCHLGCLRCALPVRIDDLLAWGLADVLPLMTAHKKLPAHLQPVAQWLPSAAQPVETPSWGCRSSLPGPPEAVSPGSWLRCALRSSQRAAQGPVGGCGAAVRPDQSRRFCAVEHPGGGHWRSAVRADGEESRRSARGQAEARAAAAASRQGAAALDPHRPPAQRRASASASDPHPHNHAHALPRTRPRPRP